MASTQLRLGLLQASGRHYPLKMPSSFPEIFPTNKDSAPHLHFFFPIFFSIGSNHANPYLFKLLASS